MTTEYEALKADRDAQQKRADALAVENAALKDSNRKLINEQQASWPIGLLDSFIAEHDPETPATAAAVREIEARGVENFADSEHCSQEAHFCAYRYLSELREAK